MTEETKDTGSGRGPRRDESEFDGHASANARRQSEWRKRNPEKWAAYMREWRKRKNDG